MSMEVVYYKKLAKEWRDLEKMTLWKEILKELARKRSVVSDYCETEREDVRFYQGRASMLRDILGKRGGEIRIIKDIFSKAQGKINLEEEK